MNIFLIAIVGMLTVLKYKWNIIKQKWQDPISARFDKPNSYLNNLVNYEYFTAMKNHYKRQISYLNKKEL